MRPGRGALAALAPLLVGAVSLTLSGCSNNPYPAAEHREALIYRYLLDEPKTLDPSVCYLVSDGEVVAGLYTTFFQYHYLKQNPSFQLILGMGAAMPKREPYSYTARGKTVHGEQWTFRIKKGLRFADDPCFPGGRGREIVAADFIHTFKRMADPDIPCPVLSYFADKVIGLQDYVDRQQALAKAKKPADYRLDVPGLQVDPRDPYTFTIRLNQPYPQLKYLMAMNFTTPLAHEATSRYGKGLAKHPVGQGPYIIADWKPRERILLRRNPNYRTDDVYPSDGDPGDREAGLLADAGKRLPLNDGVVYNIVREPITLWNLFLQGYLDSYGIDQQNYAQAVTPMGGISPEMARKGITLSRATGVDFNYFGFNMQDPVYGGFSEKARKLRQAISLAYDAGAELNLFEAGLGKETQSLLPPGVFGYDPNYRNPYRQTNLARAKRLLAEAGYPDGIDPATGSRLELTFDNAWTDAAARQRLAFLQRQIEQLGIRFISRVWRSDVWQDKLDHGEAQFYGYGWIADYPDPENFVFLLYGPNKRPGPNSTAYDNPVYNRIFEKARAMDDTPERARLLHQLRDIASEDCPYVYRFHDEYLRLSYPWFHNLKSHPIALDLMKYRRIDAAERARLREAWNTPFYWPVLGLFALVLAATVPAVATVRNRRRQTARSREQ